MTARILQGPKLDYTVTSTLGQFFFDSAEKFKDRVCYVDVNTDQHVSYSEIKRKSTRMALMMAKYGISSEDVIMTCFSVTLDSPVPVLATLFLGAKLANLDPTLSARHISHLVSLVSPRMIFVEESSVSLIEESLQLVKMGTEIVVLGNSLKYLTFSSFLVEQSKEKEFRPVVVDLQETAMMFFSSGTTGLAKAICHSHQSFLRLVPPMQDTENYGSVLYFTTFYWISGMVFLATTFSTGGRRILCSNNAGPANIFHYIEKYKVTQIFVAPVLTYQLTTFTDYKKYDTSSVRSMSTGGTAISASQLRKISEIFQHANIMFGYGLTEVGGVTMLNLTINQRKIGSSGKPLPGILLKIVDTEDNKMLSPHQTGEICLKSLSIMIGYYKTDCSHLFDADGFLKTGDIGYYDEEGYLYVNGRLKEMFKYLSWHIVPASLEEVLFEHPQVAEAVVFGLPKNEEEGEVPAACVVLKEGSSVNAEEIQDFVAARVADREKLRGGVYFLKELNHTPTGKVKRTEVRNQIIEMLHRNEILKKKKAALVL